MKTKKCPGCGEIKTENHFYRRSGEKSYLLRSYCKKCEGEKKHDEWFNDLENNRAKSRENNKKRKDKIKIYNRKHHLKIRNKIWRKKQLSNIQKKYRKLNPGKIKCRTIANAAILSGKLIRKPCIICGNKKSQAHHEDYSKPLDVIWICRYCHYDLHEKMKKQYSEPYRCFFKY